MISRYYLHNYYTILQISYKLNIFKERPVLFLKSIIIQAGLYKLSTMSAQHNLIATEVAGLPTVIQYQRHGKREKQTGLYQAKLLISYAWDSIDKLIHELIPRMNDFLTSKWLKRRTNVQTFTFRIRQRLSFFDGIEDLTEYQMHTEYRGVYLPLSIIFQLVELKTYLESESFLYMMRVPIILFRRKPKPAFDDLVNEWSRLVERKGRKLFRYTRTKKWRRVNKYLRHYLKTYYPQIYKLRYLKYRKFKK